jgi:hypothetical protein
MLKKLFAFVLIFTFSITSFSQTLQKGFQSPPDDARIMMRWWWFGPTVTKPEIEKELRTMKEGGIGGVEVQPVYPLLPDDEKNGIRNLPYLSDEFIDMLRFTGVKTKELGMRLDLTLGSGWSFGGAKTPISEAAGQLRIERVKIDNNTRRIPVPSMISAEKFLGAFLLTSDKSWQELTNIKEDNVFLSSDDAKKGNEIAFIIGGKSGMQVKRPSVGAEGYVLNHLDKPSVDAYLKKTGDRLYSAFTPTNRPYSFFCDSLEVYQQDWTDTMLAEFQKRRGYDIRPLLPALILENAPKSAEIRYDWGRTITEVFNDNFMIPMQNWAKLNKTKFRIQGYGIPPAAISSNQWADIADGEGAQWKVVRAARWASSANHIFGRNITSSETWTWLHSPAFRATPLDLKAEADIHFLQGINQLIGHGWAYTPPQVEYPGWRFYAAGEYSDRNPWWIVMPDLAKYLQRMSWLMRQGEPQNDVALYLPNADSYARFSPAKVHLIDMEREHVGDKIMPSLFENGYNLNFFDDDILNKFGKVEKENLTLGAAKHKAVVLPKIERMPLASLKKLDDFVKNGGVLIAVGKIPSIVPGYKTTEAEQNELKSIVSRLFDGKNPRVKLVKDDEDTGKVLKEILQPDAEISPNGKDFGIVHRKTATEDVYFVANTSNVKKNVQITFRTNAPSVEIWNAMNGESSAANVRNQENNSTSVVLNFEPYQSHVVVFSKSKTPKTFRNPQIADISATDLSKDWKVSFGKTAPISMPQLTDWISSDETKYFSGTATYEKTFNYSNSANNNITLDFGEASPLDSVQQTNGMATYLDAPVKEAAVVYLNEKRVGSLWAPPYKLDVTSFVKAGENRLKIVVANTAINYMAGRKLPDYRLLNLRYGERFQPQEMQKVIPYSSGLTGGIKLVSYSTK